MERVIDAYIVAVITEAEDKRLRGNDLESKMPNNWAGLDDPLARWNKIGIKVPGLGRKTGQPGVSGPKFETAIGCISGNSAGPRNRVRLNRFMIKRDWENQDLWLDCPAKGSR